MKIKGGMCSSGLSGLGSAGVQLMRNGCTLRKDGLEGGGRPRRNAENSILVRCCRGTRYRTRYGIRCTKQDTCITT